MTDNKGDTDKRAYYDIIISPPAQYPIISQESYKDGDTVLVTLPELPNFHKQYVAIGLPNDSGIYVLDSLNAFTPFDDNNLPAWQGDDTAIEISEIAGFHQGEYTVYLLIMPIDVDDPMTVDFENWIMGTGNFSVLASDNEENNGSTSLPQLNDDVAIILEIVDVNTPIAFITTVGNNLLLINGIKDSNGILKTVTDFSMIHKNNPSNNYVKFNLLNVNKPILEFPNGVKAEFKNYNKSTKQTDIVIKKSYQDGSEQVIEELSNINFSDIPDDFPEIPDIATSRYIVEEPIEEIKKFINFSFGTIFGSFCKGSAQAGPLVKYLIGWSFCALADKYDAQDQIDPFCASSHAATIAKMALLGSLCKDPFSLNCIDAIDGIFASAYDATDGKLCEYEGAIPLTSQPEQQPDSTCILPVDKKALFEVTCDGCSDLSMLTGNTATVSIKWVAPNKQPVYNIGIISGTILPVIGNSYKVPTNLACEGGLTLVLRADSIWSDLGQFNNYCYTLSNPDTLQVSADRLEIGLKIPMYDWGGIGGYLQNIPLSIEGNREDAMTMCHERVVSSSWQ